MLQFTFDQNQHSSLAGTPFNTVTWPNAELPRQSRNEGCLKGRVNVFMFVLACLKNVMPSKLFPDTFSRNNTANRGTRMRSRSAQNPYLGKENIPESG